jgi:Ca2+-binding RTX toxin-like protein
LGNDNINGGDGRDLLIGGSNADTLFGGLGDDLLIAGKLTYFNETDNTLNSSAIKAIMDEWKRTNADYATRVAHLRDGGGLNGSFRLKSTTIKGDGSAVDQLMGNEDLDWFLASAEDILLDPQTDEVVTVF